MVLFSFRAGQSPRSQAVLAAAWPRHAGGQGVGCVSTRSTGTVVSVHQVCTDGEEDGWNKGPLQRYKVKVEELHEKNVDNLKSLQFLSHFFFTLTVSIFVKSESFCP